MDGGDGDDDQRQRQGPLQEDVGEGEAIVAQQDGDGQGQRRVVADELSGPGLTAGVLAEVQRGHREDRQRQDPQRATFAADGRGPQQQAGDQRDEPAGEQPQPGRRRQRRAGAGGNRLDEGGGRAEPVGAHDPADARPRRGPRRGRRGNRRQDRVNDHCRQEAQGADRGPVDPARRERQQPGIDDLDPQRAEVPGQAEQAGQQQEPRWRRRATRRGRGGAGAQHRAEQQPVERRAQQEADDVDECGQGGWRHREIVSCRG
jgi:hypothetical protein